MGELERLLDIIKKKPDPAWRGAVENFLMIMIERLGVLERKHEIMQHDLDALKRKGKK